MCQELNHVTNVYEIKLIEAGDRIIVSFGIGEHIPISKGVKIVNQLLGLDLLYMVSGGRMVLVVK